MIHLEAKLRTRRPILRVKCNIEKVRYGDIIQRNDPKDQSIGFEGRESTLMIMFSVTSE